MLSQPPKALVSLQAPRGCFQSRGLSGGESLHPELDRLLLEDDDDADHEVPDENKFLVTVARA